MISPLLYIGTLLKDLFNGNVITKVVVFDAHIWWLFWPSNSRFSRRETKTIQLTARVIILKRSLTSDHCTGWFSSMIPTRTTSCHSRTNSNESDGPGPLQWSSIRSHGCSTCWPRPTSRSFSFGSWWSSSPTKAGKLTPEKSWGSKPKMLETCLLLNSDHRVDSGNSNSSTANPKADDAHLQEKGHPV